MHAYISRTAEKGLEAALARSPAAAVLGPRQCGKSTLAKAYLSKVEHVYLDLQDRADRNKLNEPELFLDANRHKLTCLDEIQLLPEFFSVLRAEIDRTRRPGRFLILGSASRDLIRQSSESLAGRIAYLALTPFLFSEVEGQLSWQELWVRGGFPDSALAASSEESVDWRLDFVRTFLERDIPALGMSIPIPVMERLWRLLAHYHGQTVNYSKMAEAADLSVPTLKKYLAVLEQTYMVRLLSPFQANFKKRLVKSPKVYLRDTGILHTLLDIESFDRLLAHPQNGASFESFVIENVIQAMPRHRASFLRTSNGAEVDLIMERGNSREVFEVKLSKAPKPSRGFHEIVADMNPDHAWIVAPVDEAYPYSENVQVVPLSHFHL